LNQCDQRYGTPTNISSIFQGAYKLVANYERRYKRDGIGIKVCFVAGREISISYQASSVIFSNEKVAKLIEIDKQGRDWTWPVRPENPVSATENPLSDKCKELYSSDGGQIEVTT